MGAHAPMALVSVPAFTGICRGLMASATGICISRNAIMQLASYFLRIQSSGKSYRSREFTISELGIAILGKSFRLLPLAGNQELIALQAYVHVSRSNSRKNGPQMKCIIVPSR